MNNQSLKRAFLALSIVFVLVFSCFSVNVFADTTTDGTVTTSPEDDQPVPLHYLYYSWLDMNGFIIKN